NQHSVCLLQNPSSHAAPGCCGWSRSAGYSRAPDPQQSVTPSPSSSTTEQIVIRGCWVLDVGCSILLSLTHPNAKQYITPFSSSDAFAKIAAMKAAKTMVTLFVGLVAGTVVLSA